MLTKTVLFYKSRKEERNNVILWNILTIMAVFKFNIFSVDIRLHEFSVSRNDAQGTFLIIIII